MAERERQRTPPYGGVFVARNRVLEHTDIKRAIWRMSHEIVEHNHGTASLVIVGLQTGGVWLAQDIVAAIGQIVSAEIVATEEVTNIAESPVPTVTNSAVTDASAKTNVFADKTSRQPPCGTLDVAFHRDDIGLRPLLPEAPTEIPVNLDNQTVVLVDDVLYTGRTIRAGLDALNHYGRPRKVKLAVMVDRGHRELPIRPDYVGKNLPTRSDEVVHVSRQGVDIGEIRK